MIELDLNTRKTKGIFYTEDKEISALIFSVINLDDLLNKPNLKILEPSCGDGTLILNIMDYIYERVGAKILLHFLKVLYFNDISKSAVMECFTNIHTKYQLLTGQKLDLTLNYFSEDFVDKENCLMKMQFDYIIGNPPYVSYYGRRSVKKTENLRNKYLQEYKQFAGIKNGKLNLIMLFIENSLDILKINGKLSFIVDANFTEKPYFLTRKHIQNVNCYISKIIKNIACFAGVASGQLIIEVAKNENHSNPKEIVVFDYQTKENWLITNYDIKTEKNYKLNLTNLDQATLKILSKIKQNTQSYKTIYPTKTLRTSSMLLNLENEFISEKIGNKELGEKQFYYYQGSKALSEKFVLKSTNKVLNYDKAKADKINEEIKLKLMQEGIKNKKRVMLGNEFSFAYPKIFIRQSAKQIITALDFTNSTANNSLYMICSNDKFIFNLTDLLFLNGYLNSDLITFFAQKTNIIRFFKGKQPQISLSDLHLLPIIIEGKIKAEIASIAKKIIAKKIAIDNGLKLINLIVYDFFKITKKEIKEIERSISLF